MMLLVRAEWRKVCLLARGIVEPVTIHRKLPQHPPAPLDPRLPSACELRENQPCRVKRTRARLTQRARALSHPLGRGQQNSFQTPSTTETNCS